MLMSFTPPKDKASALHKATTCRTVEASLLYSVGEIILPVPGSPITSPPSQDRGVDRTNDRPTRVGSPAALALDLIIGDHPPSVDVHQR